MIYCHPVHSKFTTWHNSAYSFFFLSKTPWFCIFCCSYWNISVLLPFTFIFFSMFCRGGGGWRDVPYMYFKVVINTIIHFSFSATRVISKCILIFPNKTDNSVHKAIIGKFKKICSNYQMYVIFKVFFYFRSKKFFIIFPAWYGIN